MIPSRAKLGVDCRVPPELGEEHVRARSARCSATTATRSSSTRRVVGNSSPLDTPLMDSIRAFVEREDPGAEVAPVVLPGFTDSHWLRRRSRIASPTASSRMRAMDLFEATR